MTTTPREAHLRELCDWAEASLGDLLNPNAVTVDRERAREVIAALRAARETRDDENDD